MMTCDINPSTLQPFVISAVWTRYNNDAAPATVGFSAGISIVSNTTAYVGFGMYGTWRLPGRVQITTSTIGTAPKTPGVYVPLTTEHHVKYPEYLAVPEGCICQWMPATIAVTHVGMILTGAPVNEVRNYFKKIIMNAKFIIISISFLVRCWPQDIRQWSGRHLTSANGQHSGRLLEAILH
jgi:hypothetical protein